MLATNLKVLAIVLGTLFAYTALANMIPQVQSEVPEELTFTGDFDADDLVAAGEDLYSGAGGCTACHGLGTRAPNLLTDEGGTGVIGARCAARVESMDCKEYLHTSMVDPGSYVVEGYQNIMPDVSRTLSPAQVWAMVAFLESQGGEVTVSAEDVQAAGGTGAGGPQSPPGETAPAAQPSSGSTDPMQLLQGQACLACHQLGGEGGPIGPPFDGMGARLDADRIRRGILDPNAEIAEGYEAVAGTMPATFGQQLTAGQLEIIVQFLAEQQ